MDSEMDKLVRQLKKDHVNQDELKVVVQLVESILSLIHSLIDEVPKIYSVENSLSVLSTRFEYLTNQIVELEKNATCIKNKEELKHLMEKISLIDKQLRDIKQRIEDKEQEEIKEKKEYFVNQGKFITLLSMLIAFMLFIFEKKLFPFLQKFF